eukprot:jgi/Undpi1/8613/HiC_scaffold_25.g11078.m1
MMGTASTVAGMGIALYVSLEAYNQGGLFAWHPFCMSLGALGLSTAGIQAVRSRRTAEGLQAKTRRVQLHSALYNLALLSMLGGLYAIYSNKELMGKNHWTSWHAWGGLFALALWVANVALAGNNTADLGRKRLVFLWQSRNHRWLGAAAYTAALATVSSGFHSGWGLRCLGGQRGAWALTAAVAAVFLGVVSQGLGAAPVRRKRA